MSQTHTIEIVEVKDKKEEIVEYTFQILSPNNTPTEKIVLFIRAKQLTKNLFLCNPEKDIFLKKPPLTSQNNQTILFYKPRNISEIIIPFQLESILKSYIEKNQGLF